MIKHPLITVIIPAYNVGRYIEEAINSLIDQTIGFEKNIEVILINDGSTDNTSNICKLYVEKFPDNIRFVDQTNKGVSAARNNGLEHARGKYINFLDADDVWSRNAFKQSIDFLENHEGSVDLVASKIKFFEGIIDSHPTNYKFKQTRVIDLAVEPDNPISHIITCVIRKEALEGKEFDERLPITEDAKLLSEILLNKKAYGVLRGTTYHYRKRSQEGSLISGQKNSREYYITVPNLAYVQMLNGWRDEAGKVAMFMQYQILSDLFWRLQQSSQDVLTAEEEDGYKQTIFKIIRELDDKVVLTRRGLDVETKIYLLKVKHGIRYQSHISVRDDRYYFSNILLYDAKNLKVHIDFIHANNDGSYELEGRLVPAIHDTIGILEAGTTRSRHRVVRRERAQQTRNFLSDTVSDGGGFAVTVNVANKDELLFCAKSPESCSRALKLSMGKFSGLTPLNYSYTKNPSHIVRRTGKHLVFKKASGLRALNYEVIYMLRIVSYWRLRDAAVQFVKLRRRNLHFLNLRAKLFEVAKPLLVIAETVFYIPRAILLRLAYFSIGRFIAKPIWLVGDRGTAAGDNGEALFRFIGSQKHVRANMYFVISKQSTDYGRMKQYGKVADQGSLKHKLLFLLSERVISSHADIETTNPFIRQGDQLVDLFKFKFVFLQHGIIKHDLSSWLNRFEKNISIFVTSSQREYNSILHYPYYYTENKILLSGLPRYDYLRSAPSGKLIIAPTYRANLINSPTNSHGARRYDEEFKHSEFFEFYNKLINDPRVTATLRKYEMVGEFYPHPNIAAQAVDFQGNNEFTVEKFPYDYQRLFREGNILVSDYSSTVYDFAYLKKPVIYSQFDTNKFFQGQVYEQGDYYDEELDTFGPVTKDYESTAFEIIRSIEGGSTMQQKYKERVDGYFAYHDQNNSRRVYEAISRTDKV